MSDRQAQEKHDIVSHKDNQEESTTHKQQGHSRLFNTYDEQRPTHSVFDSVPAELLAFIFEACVALEMYTPNSFFHQTSKAPWPLTQVCRSWRQTAQNTPSLWTTVRVSVDTLEELEHPPDDTAAILSSYLGNSHPLPFSLVIISEDEFPDYILLPLIDTCERWHDLFLFMHPDDFARMAIIRGRLPALQCLHIIPTRVGEPIVATPVMFELAPALTKATLGGHALNLNFALPWVQIREFEANYAASAEVLPLLALMPSLVRLKLGLEPADHSPVDARVWMVTHHGVRALTMNVAEGQIMAPDDLINSLTLPSLTDLEVECPVVERVESTRAFVARSGCSLDALTLVITFHCMGTMESLFRLTPRLRALTVFDGVSITNTPLLEAMVVREEDPGSVLLPKLESITLLASRPLPEADVHRWLNAFESRVHPKQPAEDAENGTEVSPLRSILMGCTSGEHIVDNQECVHRFHRMMEEGVKVDLWYGPDLF
ncbi:hypothetical protein EV121DRAFT_278532 [Schizophyllum commune]